MTDTERRRMREKLYRAWDQLEILRADIDAARAWRGAGGMKGAPPELAQVPPSVLAYLERLVRHGLDDRRTP